MTTIKDSVHDHITVEGVAADLLDTPAVQRLRRIRQLGTVSLVYPSANHTRFEHSLGVYHLACEALDHLGVDGEDAERVRAAAMLHDVGHAPFSHTLEELVHRRTGRYHDDVGDVLGRGEVARVLEAHGLRPGAVADLVAGEGRLGQLIAGELDVDRMDYLVRDAHHTGVPYGTIDHGRLVRELTFLEGTLALDEGNVQAGESLLLARALMNPTVYAHHVARISKAVLRRAAERLVETDVSADELARMDDADLLAALRTEAATAPLVERLDTRRLHKRAVWVEMADVPESVIEADHDRIEELERSVADRADVAEREVILDVPPEPEMRESSTRVLVGGEVRRLDEQSPLVGTLRAAHREQWRLGVYAPREHTDRVGRAARSVLGLEAEALLSEVQRPGDATLDEFE